MTVEPGPPDTIVLIHGFWVTPRSWEHWVERYQARGYTVLAPAYPGFEVEVEALNAPELVDQAGRALEAARARGRDHVEIAQPD